MLTPAYSVVLGDRKIDTTDDPQASTVVELFVEKRMDGAADHALVVLGNVGGLDPERGDQGAVELGYEESTALTPVLAGSVVSIDRSLNQQRVLVYSAISTLARTYSDRTFEEMRAGEIVSELADDAGVPTAEVEDGTLYPAYVADSQRSALWHIRELARLNGFDVFVDSAGELHFHQFAGAINKHVFDYGQHIVELQVLDSPDHAEQVDFRGESPGAGSGDQSWAWLAKSSEGSWATAGDGESVARVESSAIRTGAGARTAADSALQSIRRAAVKGRLLTFGSPQIELGDALQVRNAPLEELNAVYQVRAVKHRIVKAGGFTTEIELGGIE